MTESVRFVLSFLMLLLVDKIGFAFIILTKICLEVQYLLL
jgi:hypothetical protein